MSSSRRWEQEDVEALDEHHVLLAVGDEHEAVLVEVANIARVASRYDAIASGHSLPEFSSQRSNSGVFGSRGRRTPPNKGWFGRPPGKRQLSGVRCRRPSALMSGLDAGRGSQHADRVRCHSPSTTTRPRASVSEGVKKAPLAGRQSLSGGIKPSAPTATKAPATKPAGTKPTRTSGSISSIRELREDGKALEGLQAEVLYPTSRYRLSF